MKKISKALFDAQDWVMFLESVSPQQRSILICLGKRSLPAYSIALECLQDERSIGAQLSRLKKEGLVIATEKSNFAVSVRGLAIEAEKQRMFGNRGVDKDEAIGFLKDRVYAASADLFEFLEHQQLISRNGHHMAQNLAEYAAGQISKSWRG